MDQSHSKGISCSECCGVCCTFVANSMQITPAESEEIIQYLKDNGLVNKDLIEKLKSTTKKYRLDVDISDGYNRLVRRTYTCPFFLGQSNGCSLPVAVKPYGCLAFNPIEKGISDGGNCVSSTKLLEEVEQIDQDKEFTRNEKLKSLFNLNWNKRPIPTAILDMIQTGQIDQ